MVAVAIVPRAILRDDDHRAFVEPEPGIGLPIRVRGRVGRLTSQSVVSDESVASHPPNDAGACPMPCAIHRPAIRLLRPHTRPPCAVP